MVVDALRLRLFLLPRHLDLTLYSMTGVPGRTIMAKLGES